MPKTLFEYADWLDERRLKWPAPPKRVPVSAEPYVNVLAGIRAVAFDVYGTLLRISDGRLLFVPPHPLRLQVALDKTIKEFNIWNSLTRQPGAPWEGLLPRYQRSIEEQQLSTTLQPGDFPEIDAAKIWSDVIRLLQRKEYAYSRTFFGNLNEYGEKIAYFFHSSLQGCEAEQGALDVLRMLASARVPAGLIADGQEFTVVQMLRALRKQGTLPALDEVIDPDLVTLSGREGIRKPSRSLFTRAVGRFRRQGLAPHQVLYVGSRLQGDLAVAKSLGMRTALLAADQSSMEATPEDFADREVRPERLLTEFSQISLVLGM